MTFELVQLLSLIGSDIDMFQFVQLLYPFSQDLSLRGFHLFNSCILSDKIWNERIKLVRLLQYPSDIICHWQVSTCSTPVSYLTGSDNGELQLVQLLYPFWQDLTLTSFYLSNSCILFDRIWQWQASTCPTPVSFLIGSDNDRFQLVQLLYFVSKRHLRCGRHQTRTSHLECKVRLY